LLVDARSRVVAADPDVPSAGIGIVVGVVAIAAQTQEVYPERRVAPGVSLGVVYMPGMLVVSTVWGPTLGAATAVLSVRRCARFCARRAIAGMVSALER